MMKFSISILFGLALAFSFRITLIAQEYIYVGTYNEKDNPGIFVYEFDRAKAILTPIQEVGGMNSPSYLELHPGGKYLYAVNRSTVLPDRRWGSVSAWLINQKTGQLDHINDQPTFGSESCHVNIDSKGRLVFVSNYSTGNICVFPVTADGALDVISESIQHEGSSINESRQKAPHVHQSILTPDDKYLFVSDLGIDKVKVYAIDYVNNKLIPLPSSDGLVEKGSGPRHSVVHTNQKFAYVINEMGSTVTLFNINSKDSRLEPVQSISTVPENYEGVNYCADIHIDPTGKFLYGSNRGHNSLAIFSIDPNSGRLAVIGHQSTFGEWPRNFLIDPKGEFIFVANQNSNNIVLFRILPETGLLEKIDAEVMVNKPVCIKILEL